MMVLTPAATPPSSVHDQTPPKTLERNIYRAPEPSQADPRDDADDDAIGSVPQLEAHKWHKQYNTVRLPLMSEDEFGDVIEWACKQEDTQDHAAIRKRVQERMEEMTAEMLQRVEGQAILFQGTAPYDMAPFLYGPRTLSAFCHLASQTLAHWDQLLPSSQRSEVQETGKDVKPAGGSKRRKAGGSPMRKPRPKQRRAGRQSEGKLATPRRSNRIAKCKT